MKNGTRNYRRRISLNPAVVVCLILMMTVSAGLAYALEKTPQSNLDLLTMTSQQAARLSPLLQEMRGLLISEKEQLTILYSEFAKETDSQRALEIQGKIREVKIGTEISLLVAQAETARSQGRVEDADRLEESIELLSDPMRGQGTVVPTLRPGAEEDGNR